MESRPALRERSSVANRVIEKIKAFLKTFIKGVD
jgi:type I restriction enzyme R subunit